MEPLLYCGFVKMPPPYEEAYTLCFASAVCGFLCNCSSVHTHSSLKTIADTPNDWVLNSRLNIVYDRLTVSLFFPSLYVHASPLLPPGDFHLKVRTLSSLSICGAAIGISNGPMSAAFHSF